MATTPTEQAVPTDEARIRELLPLNLFAVFSERDPERRLKAIVANYTEDVIWSSPEATTHGHAESNEGAQKLIDRTPDFVFTAAGPVHVLRDLGYLAFTYGLPDQPPASIGSDVAARTRRTHRRVVHAAQRIHRPAVAERRTGPRRLKVRSLLASRSPGDICDRAHPDWGPPRRLASAFSRAPR
jgi:hypothetical protein